MTFLKAKWQPSSIDLILKWFVNELEVDAKPEFEGKMTSQPDDRFPKLAKPRRTLVKDGFEVFLKIGMIFTKANVVNSQDIIRRYKILKKILKILVYIFNN